MVLNPLTADDLERINKSLKETNNLVKASQTAKTGGRKFDGGKLQYGLVPPNALKATVEILTDRKSTRLNSSH